MYTARSGRDLSSEPPSPTSVVRSVMDAAREQYEVALVGDVRQVPMLPNCTSFGYRCEGEDQCRDSPPSQVMM